MELLVLTNLALTSKLNYAVRKKSLKRVFNHCSTKKIDPSLMEITMKNSNPNSKPFKFFINLNFSCSGALAAQDSLADTVRKKQTIVQLGLLQNFAITAFAYLKKEALPASNASATRYPYGFCSIFGFFGIPVI